MRCAGCGERFEVGPGDPRKYHSDRCRRCAKRRREGVLVADVPEGRSSAETLRLCLSELRSRGLSFDQAWPLCLRRVGTDPFLDHETAWRAGYERINMGSGGLHELQDAA